MFVRLELGHMKLFVMKIVLAVFMLSVLGITYFSAKWALGVSLKRAFPTKAEKSNCKAKADEFVWFSSKQVLYYAIAVLSIFAYLLPWDYASWCCLIFTAIIAVMEGKDNGKAVANANSKLSRTLKHRKRK